MGGQDSSRSDNEQDGRVLDAQSVPEEEMSDDLEIAYISDTACSFVR